MTVKEIAGVRELTAHECSEINGGCWGSIFREGIKLFLKTAAGEAVASFLRNAYSYVCSLFS